MPTCDYPFFLGERGQMLVRGKYLSWVHNRIVDKPCPIIGQVGSSPSAESAYSVVKLPKRVSHFSTTSLVYDGSHIIHNGIHGIVVLS